MKKLILCTLVILVFCNCQNKKESGDLSSAEIKDINEIVEAIIIQDSLDVFYKNKDSRMICSELKKLKIFIPEKRKDELIPPPPPRDIYITSLINSPVKNEIFFTSKDSSYLLQQNSNPEKLKIEENLLTKLNTTTYEKAIVERKKTEIFRFYEMTIPVFSLDRQKAYLQLDYSCGHLCGNGKAIYLKKIKGKWRIIQKWETWIS